MRALRLALARAVHALDQERLRDIRVVHVDDLHVFAGLVGIGKAVLVQLGEQCKLLRAAARHGHFAALEILDRLNLWQILPREDARTALRKTGDNVDRRAARAAGDRSVHPARRDVDLAGHERRDDVDAFGKNLLVDLEIIFWRDLLHVVNGAVMRELHVAQPDNVLSVGGEGGRGEREGEAEWLEHGGCGEGLRVVRIMNHELSRAEMPDAKCGNTARVNGGYAVVQAVFANSTKKSSDCGFAIAAVLAAVSRGMPERMRFTGTSSFLPLSVFGTSGMA